MKKIVDDERLIVKCCSLYYDENLGQKEIADILKISRPTVSRLLKAGRENGIVEVKIHNYSDKEFRDLEKAIEQRFDLREAIVVQDKAEEFNQKNEIGYAIANYLMRIVKKGDRVGVSMGTTIKQAARYVDVTRPVKAVFVPLIGGVGQVASDIHPNQIAMDLANAFSASVKLLHAPAMISNPALIEQLKEDEGLHEVLEEMDHLNIALVGVGSPRDPKSSVMASGYFNEEKLKSLGKFNAVGDICLQFYDDWGNTEPFICNQNVFGIDITRLKRIPIVIGAVANESKWEAVLGAIRGGFINVVVMNTACAIRILKETEELNA
jgi:DNA-binding transcriptional regulator LsrR (DeoR family)